MAAHYRQGLEVDGGTHRKWLHESPRKSGAARRKKTIEWTKEGIALYDEGLVTAECKQACDTSLAHARKKQAGSQKAKSRRRTLASAEQEKTETGNTEQKRCDGGAAISASLGVVDNTATSSSYAHSFTDLHEVARIVNAASTWTEQASPIIISPLVNMHRTGTHDPRCNKLA